MRGISAERQLALNEAREMRDGWIRAEKALMTSQEFRMGTKTLRRVDLPAVAERINFWTNQVSQLEGRSGIRVQQIVPRDI